MRPAYALALVVVLVGGVFALERTTRFDPGSDATVRALTTDPVRVQLDFSPSEAEVAQALVTELEAAAMRADAPELADELSALADDEGFISDLAARTVNRLRTDAAALAFSSTSVSGSGSEIIISGVTIEMLPRGRRDGISRDHEDGHAAINNGIIDLCGPAIVAYEIAGGASGSTLVGRINDHIALLESEAHSQYHVDVSDGVFGSHGRAAARALESIERNGCVARAA